MVTSMFDGSCDPRSQWLIGRTNSLDYLYQSRFVKSPNPIALQNSKQYCLRQARLDNIFANASWVRFYWPWMNVPTLSCVDPLRPIHAIWQHVPGSIMAQVTACFLTAPSHYKNHCCFNISKVTWHSSEVTFARDMIASNKKSAWKSPI